MAKGPIITDEVKRTIAAVYDAHKDWRAKQVQYEVDIQMHGKGPGLSTIQKALTEIRRRDEHRGLDEPWSLTTLDMKPEYELPPEVIPIVLEAKHERSLIIKRRLSGIDTEHIASIRREYENMLPQRTQIALESLNEPLQPLSVREAKWIARIYHVLKDKVTFEGIYTWAVLYAGYQRVCELADVKCNTSSMDDGLFIGDLAAYICWVLGSNMSYKLQEVANDIERKVFGQTLENIELTPLGWTLYALWLSFIEHNTDKWPNLSIKEREHIVKRLRAWVLEQEPVEEFSRPEELLKELHYVKPFDARQMNQNSSIVNGGTA